jgi:hypothetical protein
MMKSSGGQRSRVEGREVEISEVQGAMLLHKALTAPAVRQDSVAQDVSYTSILVRILPLYKLFLSYICSQKPSHARFAKPRVSLHSNK